MRRLGERPAPGRRDERYVNAATGKSSEVDATTISPVQITPILTAIPGDDGNMSSGVSIAQPVAAADPTNDVEVKAKLDASAAALFEVKAAAEGGVAYAFNPPKGCAAAMAVGCMLTDSLGAT